MSLRTSEWENTSFWPDQISSANYNHIAGTSLFLWVLRIVLFKTYLAAKEPGPYNEYLTKWHDWQKPSDFYDDGGVVISLHIYKALSYALLILNIDKKLKRNMFWQKSWRKAKRWRRKSPRSSFPLERIESPVGMITKKKEKKYK